MSPHETESTTNPAAPRQISKEKAQTKWPAKFECPQCSRKFTRRFTLRAHLDWHNNERRFACSACGTRFTRKHDCNMHEATHNNERRFVCHGTLNDGEWGCGRRFHRASNLSRHFRSSKGQSCIKPLRDEKAAELSVARTLTTISGANTQAAPPSVTTGQLHRQTPQQTDLKVSELAALLASENSIYADSLQTASPEEHKPQAPLIVDGHASPSSLSPNYQTRRHIIVASKRGIRKHSTSFACHLCTKRFTRVYNLRSHLRAHTYETPFACTICGKAFTRQHDRKRHESLHSGEKMFSSRGSISWTRGFDIQFARFEDLRRHFMDEASGDGFEAGLDEDFRQQTTDQANQERLDKVRSTHSQEALEDVRPSRVLTPPSLFCKETSPNQSSISSSLQPLFQPFPGVWGT